MLDKYGQDEGSLNVDDDGAANSSEDEAAHHDKADREEVSGGKRGVTHHNSSAPVNLPESKSLRADTKTFYFDCGSNQRGLFVKISEVRQNRYRTSITIPEKYLKQFQEQISQLSLNGATAVAAPQQQVASDPTPSTSTTTALTTTVSGSATSEAATSAEAVKTSEK